MGIEFGPDICQQLPQAEAREWLVTNGIGGYACGTLADLPSRCYHGLLIAAIQPPVARQLMLTQLIAQATYQGSTYDLSCNRWASGALAPQGYRNLVQFHLEGTVPVWTYALDSARLERRIWMEPGQNRTYIRYSLVAGHGPLELSLKALVNYRDHHQRTDHRQVTWQPGHEQFQRRPLGVSWQPQDDGARLVLEAPGAEWLAPDPQAAGPVWYQGYRLAKEGDRGLEAQEDHLHLTSLHKSLQPGESLTVMAAAETGQGHQISGTKTAPTAQVAQPVPLSWDSKAALDQHQEAEAQRLAALLVTQPEMPPWIAQLHLAAEQFVVCRPRATAPQGQSLIAGYPWFSDWGRDSMISLAGLTAQRPAIARSILQGFGEAMDQGMIPNVFPDAASPQAPPQYNTFDATLWYVEALHQYHRSSGDDGLVEALFPQLEAALAWHQRGTRYHIHLDDDGLLTGGEAGYALTWMDAKVEDWVVTPRIGKPVEINALWYNALLVMWRFARLLGRPWQPYRDLAQAAQAGFGKFWYGEGGYCYDVIDGPDQPDGRDKALRPNQLLAIALPLGGRHRVSLLSPAQEKAVVDRCWAELWTPLGLRSLAPGHPHYQGHYGGERRSRDGAYHQGTVWGWLIGPFVQAHLKVYQDKAKARALLAGFEAHLAEGCVGSLGEIFEGDAPHAPRGAFAQAWTVAEVLRAWALTR